MDRVREIETLVGQQKQIPDFRAGDNISVSYKIIEGDKQRIQIFRGDVIQRKGKGVTETFTVRKISNGIGVERIFPLHSPNVEEIVINKSGSVRRSRIFYLRKRRGKASRIREKRR